MARVRFVLVVILLGAIVIFAGTVTPGYAIRCGDVLGPGGNFQLQQDLDCSVSDRTALTVKDGAILDLNGHMVVCGPRSFECVVLTGAGAQLHDGVVGGAEHVNLALKGIGGHTVKNITSRVVDDNIHVESDNNSLINVMATQRFSPAFDIFGNNNQLVDSIALCLEADGGCINVFGKENRLINNFLTGNIFALQIFGNNNILRGNRVVQFRGSQVAPGLAGGIVVRGTGNDIRHNTAIDNTPVDLRDLNGDCTHNTWRLNTFLTRDPACIQ